MKRFPQNKFWKQVNSTDQVGDIYVSKNLNFDEPCYVKLSPSPRAVIDQTVDADFDNPAVILFNSDYGYFVGTWDEAFEVNEEVLIERPTQIATSGVPATDIETDAVWFGGLMAVSQDTDLDYYDPSANTWTDTNISLTSDGQHQLVHFLSLNALAVVNVNTIKLYASPLTATPTLVTTLTIPSDFEITSACYFNQNIYIGTKHIFGGHAYLYIWNGLGTSAGQVYEVDSNTIFSVSAHKNTVYLTTGNGSLMRFNGSSFDPVDTFPIFKTDQSLSDDTNVAMYKNTVKSNGDLLYIAFTNHENNSNRLVDQPDGVWCYDENVGLYNRYSFSNALVGFDTIIESDVNTTTNEITVNADYITGTEVVFNSVFGITPLVDGEKYFVIRVDATHIKLATTLANALAGTAIDITSAGASNSLTFFPNTDYGQYFIRRTMSLNVIERPVSNRIYGTDVMWGGEVENRTISNSSQILGVPSDGVSSRGYFVTSKALSANVTDIYNKITIKFSPFKNELDKIIVKYRTKDDMLTYIDISEWEVTWTSSTTFTTTQAEWANAVVGDEVEFMRGAAGGLLAHITVISENAGTYTVTIDETFDWYTSGDKSVAIFRNWKKLTTFSYDSSGIEDGVWTGTISETGKFIQLKVELRGVGVRIEEIILSNTTSESATV